MPDDPVLWHLDFLWKQKMDVVMAEHFPGKSDTSITVKTDITRSLAKKDDSVTVDGSMNVALDMDPNVTILYEPHDGAGIIDFTPSRRFDTGLPELKADDNPSSDQAAKSFRFEGQFEIPAKITAEYLDQQTGEKVTKVTESDILLFLNQVRFDFPYKPGQQETYEDTEDTSDYLAKAAEVIAEAHIVLTNPEGSVKYTLKQKELDIRLEKTEEDVTKYTPYRANVARTKNVWYNDEAAQAGMEGTHMLHGNFFVQVTVDGEEQVKLTENGPESAFHIWRIARSWTTIADESGNYSKLKTGKAPETPQDGETGMYLAGGWTIDNRGAGNVDWVDVPGAKGIFKNPGEWPLSKNINEFLVSVDKYPEFGILYFASIIYTRPGSYAATTVNFGKIDPEVAKKIYRNPDCPFFMNEGPGPVGELKWVDVKDPE